MPGSTKSYLFPDVIVWVALTYKAHVLHPAAKTWFVTLGPGARLFFSRVTQLSFLRLLTSEAVMGDEVVGQREAWGLYDRWLSDGRISLLMEPPEVEEIFRGMTRLPHAAPKDWADSYLAAFATASNLMLVTFDRALHAKVEQGILLRE